MQRGAMSDSFPVGVTSEDQRLVGLIASSPLEALGEKLLDMFRQFGLPIRLIPISQNYTFPPSKQRNQYLGYEPEGLFKADWFEKHVNKLPSVLLVLLPFEPSLSDNDWTMREDSLQQDLMRVAEQVHGNKIKVMAVLIQQRDYPQSQEAKERQQLAKERILSLRRKVDYDSKSVHLLYTFDLHLGSDAVKKMLTSVSNVCVDQLKAEIKHGKDMRTKVSSAQAHVAKKSQLVLKVRQSLKIGQLYSMRLEEAKSKKEYERAYEDLVQLTHSTLPFPITMNEVKTVAQIIFFKLCRIHFNQARPGDAVTCFREHMRIFRELPRHRSRAASVGQTEEEATALETDSLLVECDKMAWGARQCMIFADLLRECRKVTDEERRQQEYLRESYLVHTALTFERRRRMLADDLLNKSDTRIADVKTVRKSRFLGGKIEAAERGLNEMESQKVVRNFLVGRESQARHRKRVIAVAERWIQAQAREHQSDTSRMALVVRVVMMEELVALGEHKRVMLLCELCVDRFKDEKWNVLFTRSLRCGAASALALGNMKAFVNYSLQLVAPTCKHLDAAERTQANEQFLRALAEPSSLGTQFADSPQDDANETVGVMIHREMCPVFETSVSFLERVVLVKNSYGVELTIKSRFALPMHFKSIHLTLVRASDEFNDEVECRVVDNTSHNTRVANTVPFLKLEQGEQQQLGDDVKATEAKEVAVTTSASLFFQPNETKTFMFTLSEENLARSDVLISGKDVGVLLDIADGSRSVRMTQGLEEAIVPSVDRGPNTLTTHYIYSYRRKDAMKGTFGLFRPRLPIPGVDVAHVAPANIPSKNIFIDHVTFLLGAKVDHSAPALVGEWHPIDIVIERPAGLLPLDVPKNVHASVKIACAGINGTLTYAQQAASDSSVTDAGELVTCEDRTFQLLNLVPVDELGSTYVITCFFQPTDSGRSWSNPCCSLILTMTYDTDRGRQLSKTVEFDIPVNNPFNVNWSIFPREPELLVPDEASKTQVTLLESEGATAFYDLSIATKHAVNVESIAFIPNEKVATSVEPFAEGTEKCSFTLSTEDVWSNCVGVQPVKCGPVDSLGMLRVTWSRTVLVPSASRVFEKHKSVCSDILLPSVMVLPSRGLIVDVKTSTTATFGVPFTTKVSIINHTVSSEVVTVRLTPNTNFMCAGRTKATVVVQSMATLVMSYCLVGLRVGYCLQPSIQVQMQKDKIDLLDPAIERTIFIKPTLV